MKPPNNQAEKAYIEGLARALRSTPRSADLWADVADMLLQTGNFEKAVRSFDLAIELDPRLHRAEIGLAIALDLCGVAMSDRAPPMMRSAVWETLQAFDALVESIDAGASPFIDVHALRIKKEMLRRLAANPNDADAMFLKSAILAKEGAFEDALAALDALAAQGVEYPGAHEFRNQLQEMIASSPAAKGPES